MYKDGGADAQDIAFQAIDESSVAVDDEVRKVVDMISANGPRIADYGTVLDRNVRGMQVPATADVLARVLADLSRETIRMSEHNRELQLQLAASSVRITKLSRALSSARAGIGRDPLTGVNNRRTFDATLRRWIRQATGEAGPAFCLALVDIDHFKLFNETHGQQSGDAVLRLVARMLAEFVRGQDVVARYNDDEFAILLKHVDIEAAHSDMRRICSQLAAQKLVGKRSGQAFGSITLSAGIACSKAVEDATTLIDRADAALRAAKQGGRNRVC